MFGSFRGDCDDVVLLLKFIFVFEFLVKMCLFKVELENEFFNLLLCLMFNLIEELEGKEFFFEFCFCWEVRSIDCCVDSL